MRLSTKTRYGVRAIFDIAYHGHSEGHVATQARDIARREDIPLRYLEQIFQDLRRAGLVESRRGPRGGYFLKKDPSQITLAEVIRALQGPIEAMFALEDADAGRAAGSSRQVTAAVWTDLAAHVSAWFDAVTVADLTRRGHALGVPRAGLPQPMYFI